MLIGNKVDLEPMRCVSTAEGRAFAASINCPFLETSARLGTNVHDAFASAVLNQHGAPQRDCKVVREAVRWLA